MNLGGNSYLNFISVSVTLIVTLWFSNCYCAESICTNSPSPCACHLKNGSVIDLTTNAADKTPRFQDFLDPKGEYGYSYNPCLSFSEGPKATACYNGVAVCQSKPGKNEYYNAGEQPSATFYYNGTNYIIGYKSTDSAGIVRSTNVTLVCSPNLNMTVVGEASPRIYELVMYSPCACPDGCAKKSPPDEGLSTGSVLVILLFTFIFCYLVGGIIYQKIIRGAQGYELIPNYEFWYDFPLLIRDGCLFSYNGCNTAPPRGTYDSI